MAMPRSSEAKALAQGLGWFSIAVGALELAAPNIIGRTVGLGRSTGLLRAYGLREIATGVGILGSRDPGPWVWGRVAGDAVDLATLIPALDQENPRRSGAALAFAAVAGVMIVDVLCARALRAAPRARVHDYRGRSGLPVRDPPRRRRPEPELGEGGSGDQALTAGR